MWRSVVSPSEPGPPCDGLLVSPTAPHWTFNRTLTENEALRLALLIGCRRDAAVSVNAKGRVIGCVAVEADVQAFLRGERRSLRATLDGSR